MKANEAPDKLYLSKNIYSTFLYQTPDPDDETEVEYTSTDAFIDKTCEWITQYILNHDQIDIFEMENDFRKAMEE